MDIQDLKPINDDNTQNWTEGSLRVKDVNDAGRADEGMICRWFFDWRGDASGAGTASAYTAASQTKPSAYYDGFRISLVLPVNNSADATLNIDSLAAVPILRTNGLPVQDDDLAANVPNDFVYMGGSFYALSVPGLGSAARADIGTAEGDVPVLNAYRTFDWEQQGGIGEIRLYGGTDTPATWFEANGQAISRTTYAALFAIYGTTYGAGDGSTTFNIPDLRDNAPRGASATYAIGTAYGAATHTLTEAQIPAHTHQQRGNNGGSSNLGNVIQTSSALDGAVADGNTASTGGGEAHPNIGPSLAVRFIVKAGYAAA